MLLSDKIKSSGYNLDRVTWNTMVAVCGKNGMHNHVAILFKEMKKVGYIPH